MGRARRRSKVAELGTRTSQKVAEGQDRRDGPLHLHLSPQEEGRDPREGQVLTGHEARVTPPLPAWRLENRSRMLVG